MLPSMESLRCFVAAAKLLHFRTAARSVALTPAAFGQRIKQLEREVGAKLFSRTTRSVQLTEAGLAMLPNAEKSLLFASQCTKVAAHPERAAATEIVLGTRNELGLSWLLPQIDSLSREHNVELDVYFGSGPDLVARVRAMDVDCAVTSTRFADPKLETLRLHREDYAFVGASSLLAKVPLTRAEHAAKHTLIDVDRNLPLFRYWLDAPGAHPQIRFARIAHFGTIEAIRMRVMKGAGVAALPLYFVRHEIAKGTLRRIFPSIALTHDWFRLVFRADDPRRPLFLAMAESLLKKPLR